MSEDTALVTTQAFNRDQLDLMKRTVAVGLSDDEFALFVMQANRLQLDPFNRQIHAVKRWNSKMGKEVMAIQVAIDGSRAIADRTGNYAPGREPSYSYRTDNSIESATSYVMKLVKGTWHEVAATAFWDEYVQVGKDGTPTSFWKKMPHLMLAKVAEALALRKAFPEQLAGVFTDDEMMQADNVVEGVVTSSHDGVREQAKNAEPSVEEESQQTGPDPYIYPKKEWKEAVSALVNEHGKLRASQLFEAIGDEAIGYMEWLWPKMVASEKKWDQQAGNELKAWLDIYKGTREIVVKPTSNTKSQLITLLKAAPDDKFITMPIINPLKQYLAEAGYVDKEGAPNMFHINGLLKKMTGNDHATLNGLTGKQAKSLVNYCAYLIENGGDTAKDFAQQVLMNAWANSASWKESCDLISSSYVQPMLPGMIDLNSICVGMGTTLANVEAALSENCGWPLPLPEKQLVDFLKVCKDKGFSLKIGEDYTRFDKIAVQLAQAVAQQEGWVK